MMTSNPSRWASPIKILVNHQQPRGLMSTSFRDYDSCIETARTTQVSLENSNDTAMMHYDILTSKNDLNTEARRNLQKMFQVGLIRSPSDFSLREEIFWKDIEGRLRVILSNFHFTICEHLKIHQASVVHLITCVTPQ